MENRNRDKVSRNSNPTNAGDINRETSERKHRSKSDSMVDFGEDIGRSEKPMGEPNGRTGSTSGSEH